MKSLHFASANHLDNAGSGVFVEVRFVLTKKGGEMKER
jgi:hypothetical protein